MVRAILEALGAYLASAPMSVDSRRMRKRQFAFALVTVLIVAGGVILHPR